MLSKNRNTRRVSMTTMYKTLIAVGLSIAYSVSPVMAQDTDVTVTNGQHSGFAAVPKARSAEARYHDTDDLEQQVTVIDRAAQTVNEEIKAGLQYDAQGTFNPGIISKTGNTLNEAVKNWALFVDKVTEAKDKRLPGLRNDYLAKYRYLSGRINGVEEVANANVKSIADLRRTVNANKAELQGEIDELREEVNNFFNDPRVANTAYFLLSEAEQSFIYSGNEGLQTGEDHRLSDRMVCLNGSPLKAQKLLHTTHGESVCVANIGSSTSPGYVYFRSQWKRVNGPMGAKMQVVDNGALWDTMDYELAYRNYHQSEIKWVNDLLRDPRNVDRPEIGVSASNASVKVSSGYNATMTPDSNDADQMVMKSPAAIIGRGTGATSITEGASNSGTANRDNFSLKLQGVDSADINIEWRGDKKMKQALLVLTASAMFAVSPAHAAGEGAASMTSGESNSGTANRDNYSIMVSGNKDKPSDVKINIKRKVENSTGVEMGVTTPPNNFQKGQKSE